MDRATALGLAGINQLATPGLGTLLAGKILAGLFQLVFSVSGFCLITFWFLTLFKSIITGAEPGPAWEWQAGVGLFGFGWALALVTSLQLVRAADGSKPPKLDATIR